MEAGQVLLRLVLFREPPPGYENSRQQQDQEANPATGVGHPVRDQCPGDIPGRMEQAGDKQVPARAQVQPGVEHGQHQRQEQILPDGNRILGCGWDEMKRQVPDPPHTAQDQAGNQGMAFFKQAGERIAAPAVFFRIGADKPDQQADRDDHGRGQAVFPGHRNLQQSHDEQGYPGCSGDQEQAGQQPLFLEFQVPAALPQGFRTLLAVIDVSTSHF